MKHAITPSKLNRRDFLKTTSLTGFALAAPSFNVLGADEAIRLAVIGLGNKGKHHVELFSALPGVRIAALCEVDPKLEGHVSSAVCHLGNISYRLARPGKLGACRDAIGQHSQVTEAFTRLAQSLEGIGVDLNKTPFALGPGLDTDPLSGQITGAGGRNAPGLTRARRLARGSHRAPYVLPS